MTERYYLGAEPGWLSNPPAGLPGNAGLFVSHKRLSRHGRDYNYLPYQRGRVGWALDSGAYTELTQHGRYTFLPGEYVWAARRYDAEIGGLEWAAQMDWPCEDEALAATGKTVDEHQDLTVENYLILAEEWWRFEDVRGGIQLGIPGYRASRDPSECLFMPTLQGRTLREYLRCADRFEAAGVHLDEHPVVGVGSLCRRSNTTEGVELMRALGYELGRRYPGRAADPHYPPSLDLHAFGIAVGALRGLPPCVKTADSHAWSLAGMKRGGRCAHPGSGVVWEQNCPQYAIEWLNRTLSGEAVPDGPVDLFTAAGVPLR